MRWEVGEVVPRVLLAIEGRTNVPSAKLLIAWLGLNDVGMRIRSEAGVPIKPETGAASSQIQSRRFFD